MYLFRWGSAQGHLAHEQIYKKIVRMQFKKQNQ